MRNSRHSDKERVRIEFKKSLLNKASNLASENGETLSDYIQRVVEADIDASRRQQCLGI